MNDVLDRPTTAPKKAAKVAVQASAEPLAPVLTAEVPEVSPDVNAYAVAYEPSFCDVAIEKLGVASAITSTCLHAVGDSLPAAKRKTLPYMVRISMRHVERLLMDIDSVARDDDIGPFFEPRYDEASVLVDLFSQFCIVESTDGCTEFTYNDDITSNMLWGIRSAIDTALKIVDPDAFPEGEAT